MREDLIELAKQQAAEIARAGHNGWGNTMLALAVALESSVPVGVARAWQEGYRRGVLDERASEDNIGIAGFGAKVEPARNNPYALAQQPAVCPKCDGTGEADSGGIYPWGAPATIPCDCQQPAADGYCVTREDGECVSSGLRCMHNKKPAGETTMNSTMQQGPLEAHLSDQLGPLPEQAGWCVLMHGHAAVFASNAERAVGLSCGATTPLFTADQMRAYAAQEVAAERERWQDAVMLELDSNGQAHAIVANATRA